MISVVIRAATTDIVIRIYKHFHAKRDKVVIRLLSSIQEIYISLFTKCLRIKNIKNKATILSTRLHVNAKYIVTCDFDCLIDNFIHQFIR